MQVALNVLADLGWLNLLFIWVVVVFAGVMRAFTGFGFALTAVPVFSLFIAPSEAVVLSSSLSLALSLLTWKTYWGKYPLKPMLPLVLLAVVGTGIGAALLSTISPQQFKLGIGLSVIAASVALVFYKPRHVEAGAFVGGLAGLGSGLMNGAFAIPGPPVIIYAMATQTDPQRTRALLMTFLMFSAILALVSFAAAGFISPLSPWLFLAAMPAMYMGDKLGYFLFQHYGTALYRRVALAALFTIGISITAKALLG